MRHWKRELVILTVLVALAVGTLIGLYDQPPTRGFDLLNKIAFAILVTVVVRSLYLVLSALEDRPPDPLVSFKQLGMCRAIERLSDDELKSRLAQAQEIRVLKTWFPETPTIREGLEEALTKGRPARVTLLLMHPGSKILEARSKSARRGSNHGAHMVIQALEDLVKWGRGVEGLEVGLYDGWPGCPVIWHDERPLMGFYLVGSPSPDWPWIEVEKGSKLDGDLNRQFHAILDTALERFSSAEELEEWLNARKADQGEAPGRGGSE